MKYIYEDQIVMVLTHVGESGLPLALLVKNIYNLNCTLFERPDWQKLYFSIHQYIRRNSSSPHSLYEKIGWGCYRIRPGVKVMPSQLQFHFDDDTLLLDDHPEGMVAEEPTLGTDKENKQGIESPSLFSFFEEET